MRKKFLYNILFSVANILFPIISFPYASGILGPSGIGKVQMAFSLAQYFSLIAAFGVPVYGIQKISKVKHDKEKLYTTLSELFYINLIASLLISMIYVLIILFTPYFSSSRTFFLIAGSIILAGCMNIDWFYAGLENFKSITYRSIAIKTISLVALFWVVKKESDYGYYLCITLFAYLGNYVLGFSGLIKNLSFRWHALDLQQHFKPLIFILGTMVVASIYTMLDTVLLGFLSNEVSVGLYTAASKLTRIAIPVITAFGTALIPSFAEHFEKNNKFKIEELIQTSFNIIILLAIPTGFGLYMLSDEFIFVFSGNQFGKASAVMKILSALPFIVGIGHLFIFQLMVPAEKNKEMFWSALTGTAVFMLLNILLVPTFREVGEAVVAVVTELIVSVVYFYFLRKSIRFDFDKKIVLHAIISSVFFIPLIVWIKSYHLSHLFTLLVSVTACFIWYCSVQLWVFKNKLIIAQYLYVKNLFLPH